MLKVINLYVIDQIFQGSDKKLSANEQMLYINILMHHFREKESTEVNAVQFEYFYEAIAFDRFSASFHGLHQAGLVDVRSDRVVFNNLWGQHIDRTLLDQPDENYDGEGHFHFAQRFRDEIEGSRSMLEHCAMRYRIDKAKYLELVGLFVGEQTAILKKYSNYSDCVGHFSKWVKYNVATAESKTVKSTGKRLGDK